MREVFSAHWGVMLFAGMFFGLIFGVLATLLAKKLKGGIHIILSKENFSYSEKIGGTLIVNARKHISVHDIELHLIAYKLQRVKSKKGVHYSYKEIYRKTEKLLGEDNLLPGVTRRIDFSVDIPEISSFDSKTQEMIHDKIQKNEDFHIGKPSRNATKLKWHLRADLDSEGLDLTCHKRIRLEN